MASPGSNAVDKDLSQLRQVLEPLTQLFDQLQVLLLQEQEMLRKRNAEALEALAKQIAERLAAIRNTDQLRQRLTTQLGKRLGMPSEGLNLEVLDKALGGDTGLLEVRKKLLASIQKAEGTNRENQAVFKGVLAATESILHALKDGTQGPVSSYNRHGSRKVGSRFNLLSKQL